MRFAAILAIVIFLIFTGSHQNAFAEVVKSDAQREEMLRRGWIEDQRQSYASALSFFDEYDQVYHAEHRKITILLAPSFADLWLIVLESYPEVTVQRRENWTETLRAISEIRVLRHSWSRNITGPEAVPWEDRVEHTRSVKDYYKRSVSKEDFERVYHSISPILVGSSEITDPIHGCTDGVSTFAEVLTHDQKKLIYRHNCDDDYAAVLDALKPLFELGWSKISEVESELRDAWLKEAGKAIDQKE